MTPIRPEPQQLARAAQGALDAFTAFQALLDDEHLALRSRDADAIDAIAGRKLALLGDLETHGRKMVNLTGTDRGSIRSLMHSAGLAALWDRLTTVAEDCSRRNRVNGGIVEMTRASTESLLAILRGHPQGGSLYGPRGKVERAGAAKSLATA